MRALAAILLLLPALLAQRWEEVCGRTTAGLLAQRQAARDAAADSLVLLVAAHPDDRYLLPAVWLRSTCGYRVAVLLATRGGGGQNSLGPETGDAFERIRTLETEVGCARAGATAYYLNRPDAGYRRSAAETFAEWDRQGTLRELVRMVRKLRPDAVVTTHHAEEGHGHDLALVELLPEAVRLAGDADFDAPGAPHDVPVFLLGARSTPVPNVVSIDVDRLAPELGAAYRRVAFDILRDAHVSPGPPNAIDDVFPPTMRFEPQRPQQVDASGVRALSLPSVLDAELWPGDPDRARALDRFLREELPERLAVGDPPVRAIADLIRELRAIETDRQDVRARLYRRVEALERLLLVVSQIQIEVEAPPGTVAVEGEEFSCTVRVRSGAPRELVVRAVGLGGIEVEMSPLERDSPSSSSAYALANVRIPLTAGKRGEDPMLPRFTADRFEPPVQLRFYVQLAGLEVPVDVTVPVEQHPTVELGVLPRMLLLPTRRDEVQFSVAVARHSRFPIEGDLTVRAPAGYAVAEHSKPVNLREQRSELFGFRVKAPRERRPGVSVLRIRLGDTKVTLPVHLIDVDVPSGLRVGVLRSRDDTLPSILGVGGLGLEWSELTDADLAVADLQAFDTIVVDIRALRDRPAARRGFGRLLEFAKGAGHRLVVFYQKDVEFHPSGEAFRGAPFAPFQIGKRRVTRADAPVRVLAPEHVLLRNPNRIRASDWDSWGQERALYLPRVYGDEYEELLELHDPGEPEERGALLYARTGDGEFVYCALALWRQLKKLHPGAVRLLANLLTPAPGE